MSVGFDVNLINALQSFGGRKAQTRVVIFSTRINDAELRGVDQLKLAFSVPSGITVSAENRFSVGIQLTLELVIGIADDVESARPNGSVVFKTTAFDYDLFVFNRSMVDESCGCIHCNDVGRVCLTLIDRDVFRVSALQSQSDSPRQSQLGEGARDSVS